jgi:ABC-2 type transport system ATP-binding protein
MSTHTLEVAEGMCDRIGIMQRGLLVACGTMRELRAENDAEDLEDIFLKLTGEKITRDVGEVLHA